MRADLLLIFVVVGVGNYLMRFLPLLWALRRGEVEEGPENAARGAAGGVPGGLLPFVGPSVVAALLVTSLPVEEGGGAGLVRAGLALLPTLLVAVRTGNLGLTVLVGVASYWLVSQAV